MYNKPEKVEATVKVVRVIFKKDDFAIVVCEPHAGDRNLFFLDNRNRFTLKGQCVSMKEDEEYNIKAVLVKDDKYGEQYILTCMSLPFTEINNDNKKAFLKRIFTPTQVENMYAVLEDPFSILEKGDAKSLTKVRGGGIKTVGDWIRKFEQHYSTMRIYVELKDYNLTNNMIDRLISHYKSPDVVCEIVKTNPYVLVAVGGIGWKKADAIVMSGTTMGQYAPERIGSFILYYLGIQGENGYSYIPTGELMGALIEMFTDEVSDTEIGNAIRYVADDLWWDDNKEFIGLQKYRDLEMNIAKEVFRISKSSSPLVYNENWREKLLPIEEAQGWSYSDEQLNGVQVMLDNNITIMHSKAGCGKTSCVNAMLQAFNGLQVGLCALSGKASARMEEVSSSSIDAMTIHRLLGFPSSTPVSKKYGGFLYNPECKLDYDIIIVDEVSMIGGYMFNALLRAVKDGAKVILLGDIGQLESIGECKVAADLIESPHVATVYLSKIHRQAEKSALVSESNMVRFGEHRYSRNYSGVETLGELQDLTVDLYSDKDNTFYKIIQYFSKELFENKADIEELQIIVPNRDKGGGSVYNLNIACQELYNPSSSKKKEIEVYTNNGFTYIFREGDKIIVTSNMYGVSKVSLNNGRYETMGETDVFNGYVGFVKEIVGDDLIILNINGVGLVLMNSGEIKSVELGYAITVHKAQGSQIDSVIVGLDYSSYSLLCREIVYTAMTRAKKKCVLVAQNSALFYAISTEKIKSKYSHLGDCLNELFIEKANALGF